jgi:hypothetical protein
MQKPGFCLRVLVAVVCVLLLAPVGGLLWGQSTTQTIQGLVTDPSGAVIPSATVTMRNLGTGVTQIVQTNETGNYTFTLVLVGNYEVRCEAAGFKADLVPSVRVETGAQVRQNFIMQVGEVTETVEVSAAAVTLNTENAVVGGVIENKRIVELPLNGRNVVQLAVLVPGVQFGERTGRGDGLQGFPIPGQGFSVSANGQRETFQVVSLDGVDAKDPRIHITNFVPSIEAIEEFKIQTSAYSAEIGFGGGAVTNITMKSGTNEIHGTLFEFLRNDKLDAENYFLNLGVTSEAARRSKDRLRRNQFGLVVSGPIIKNKTFWAFNWESRRERIETVQSATFPHDTFRQGDFSELLTGTVNPATGRLYRAPIVIFDPYNGQPFANNVIPQSRLHAGSLNVMNLYVPKADFRQTDPLDFTANKGVLQPINPNQYFGRVDHYFSDADRIFGRIAVDRSSLTSNNINPNLPVTRDSRVMNLASQWVHTFNQNAINEFRFGFNISDDDTVNPRTNDESFDMDGLGVGEFRVFGDGNRPLTAREHGLPQFTGLGFTLQELTNGNGYDRMDTFQFGDHLSLIRGSHNLKIGGEVYYITMERGAANLEEGLLGFGSSESGNAFASYLLGLPASTQTPEGLPLTFPRSTRWGAYINDDWKVTPKLTLNLGLRFDYIGVPYDTKGLWRTLDLPGDGPDIDRGAGYRTPDGATIPTIFPPTVDEAGGVGMFRQRTRFFMPRIGIAYRPTEKWVFRVGGGWFDNINHLNTWTIFNLMPPKSGSLLFQSVTNSSQTIPVVGADGNSYNVQTRIFSPTAPILTLDDPFLAKTGGTAVSRPVNVQYISPDHVDGDVWKWNFDVQRELPHEMALTVAYIGTKGTHTGNSIGNFNDALPSTNTNTQVRRPYQRFYDPATPNLGVQALGNVRFIDSFGNSFYHGLQMKLDKRYSRGLALGLAYTYSKSHGDGENGGQEGAAIQDPNNYRSSRGMFRFDQQHNVVFHYVWELPGGNLPGVLKHVLGGWQSNGIVSLRSGFPITVTQGAGDLNVVNSSVRPDRIADGRLDDPTRELNFDPQAFQRVSCDIASRTDLCHYGNSGVGVMRTLGQHNLDFSMYKNFTFGGDGRYKVQFRSEFFNAFNTPYYGNPNNIGFASLTSIVPDGARMGEVRSLRTPMRIIQFGLKFFF